MDFCFFIPIIFGCPAKIKQTDTQPHICPKCHNAQVVRAKSRTWLEVCWIPLIPMKSREIFICGICQWQTDAHGQYQPAPAGAGGFGGPQGPYGGPPQHGYYPPPKY
ncbi:hypothetical protein K437DRAFT_254803 [Tilletiaria anomala UBC 951]|uniref:Zinc-ribbon 15 domain-containing protein n=1 Tax=Tilletiaria anomala (strain ATCC 24038 / CBS 436.72 / UBC 951) TaxID=1037660 RepID=A0A066WBU7_TILAU|nr:uncharacterized protein K437DRAFT_254803 [Tilletiaria anomala UBC 951]KDN51397.1 hypothetical protein K437DRAFT_254803 [Tilletiaria anomala UBC 951]